MRSDVGRLRDTAGISVSIALLTWTLLFSIVSLTACGDSPTVTAPTAPSATATPTPPAPPTGQQFTLTGRVMEWTGQGERPLGDVRVNAWVQTGGSGYSYWFLNGPRATDDRGNYELNSLPVGATVYLTVHRDGYAQQCASVTSINGPMQLDARLMKVGSLSVAPGEKLPPAAGYRLVSGVVYESNAGVRRPAADAFVSYEAAPDFAAASTFSDAEGRFLLCGLPQDRTLYFTAYKSRVVGYANASPGSNATIEIELK